MKKRGEREGLEEETKISDKVRIRRARDEYKVREESNIK